MFKSVVVLCVIVLCAVPLCADNPLGRALVLNGEGQYFQVPDSTCADIAGLDVFTLEIRFKTDEPHGFNMFNKVRLNSQGRFDRYGWVVDIGRGSSSFDGKFRLRYIDALEAFYSPGFIRIIRAMGGGTCGGGTGGHNFASGEWHHFALIFSSGYKKVYVDGLSNGHGSSSPVDNAVIGSPLNIGGFAESVDAPLDLSAYLKGQIDEFRIWNKVLTSQEINAMMNDTLSADIYTSAESGLIGYYRFEKLENLGIGNDGLANDVRDLSVNANHGNVWNGGTLTEQAQIAGEYEIPATYQLFQNSTSSYNPSTKNNFDLPEASPVNIKVFDIYGRLVSMLSDDVMDAGSHDFSWASPRLPDGVYICEMTSNSFNKTFKIVLQQ